MIKNLIEIDIHGLHGLHTEIVPSSSQEAKNLRNMGMDRKLK